MSLRREAGIVGVLLLGLLRVEGRWMRGVVNAIYLRDSGGLSLAFLACRGWGVKVWNCAVVGDESWSCLGGEFGVG